MKKQRAAGFACSLAQRMQPVVIGEDKHRISSIILNKLSFANYIGIELTISSNALLAFAKAENAFFNVAVA